MSRRQSDNTNGLKFGLLAGDSQITKTLTQCHLERGGADSAGVALGGGENERRAGGAADAGDRVGAGGYGSHDRGPDLRDGSPDAARLGASL